MSPFARMIPRYIRKKLKALLSSEIVAPIVGLLGGHGTVLLYHRVVNRQRNPSGYDLNLPLSVHVDAFRRQMEYLTSHYRCVSLSEIGAELSSGTLSRGSVAVTFDDGYLDNLTEALPILEEYQVPATIYVTTGLIAGTVKPWWYELEHILRGRKSISVSWKGRTLDRTMATEAEQLDLFRVLVDWFKAASATEQGELLSLLKGTGQIAPAAPEQWLSWDQIVTLASHPLITIGAHTVTHPVLSVLTPEDAYQEMLQAKQILESKIKRPVVHMAYPFGEHGQASLREFELAKEAGFLTATTTRRGHIFPAHASAMFALPRMPIEYDDTMTDFRWKLSGLEARVVHGGRRFITD